MADVQVKQVQAFRMTIVWAPEAGQFQVQMPEADDVVKLGMLEAAKMAVLARQLKPQSSIVVPSAVVS